MKKFFALAGLVALTSACALTDYPVITDEDQVRQANGTHIVNTSGQAFVLQKVQVASFVGDKSYNAVWFVNQDQKGNQTIYTRMNHGLVAEPDTWFHGTTYMNDNRNTCWNIRAPNPATGDTDIFDFAINVNCEGTETIAVLLSKGERSQEAGGDGNSGTDDGAPSSNVAQSVAGVTLQQAVDVLDQLDSYATFGDWADYGMTGYKYTASPSTVDIGLANSSGIVTDFNLDGVTIVYDVMNRKAVFDTRSGNTPAILRELADWVDANGDDGRLTVTFAGVTASANAGLMSAAHLRKLADSLD